MDKIYRSNTDRILGGVCGGLGKTFDIDPNLIRIGIIILCFVTVGITILAYICAWVLLPSEDERKNEVIDVEFTYK